MPSKKNPKLIAVRGGDGGVRYLTVEELYQFLVETLGRERVAKLLQAGELSKQTGGIPWKYEDGSLDPMIGKG